MAGPFLTQAPDLSSAGVRTYAHGTASFLTEESALRIPLNYKGPVFAGAVSESTEAPLQTALRIEKSDRVHVESGRHIQQRFRGVVDQVESTSSRVTLFYDGRENKFLFPTLFLETYGISYAGALFEIILKRQDAFQTYEFVHLKQEEERARRESNPLDLSFLDDLADK
jgi:hypothetical protein